MANKYNTSTENKTLILTAYGGYDKMKVENTTRPQIKPDEVLLNVKATGINFAELMCRQGVYDRKPKTPAVLGLEAAGVIVETGTKVTNVKVGDKVVCAKDFGLWTEFAAIPAEQVFLIPEGISFHQAAAIPVNYVTAHMMLFGFGALSPKKKVLIHMAAGGVGVAAIQLCRTVPDVTIFGTASAHKHAYLRSIGVDHPIDYRTKDYVAEVRKISPDGVDIVLDPLNGPDARKGFNLLKPLGKIIHFGVANGVTGEKRSLKQLAKTWWKTKNYSPMFDLSTNRAACWYHLGHLTEEKELLKECIEQIMVLLKSGKIKPKIDSVYTFDEVASAMARIHERKNVGKVIMTPHIDDSHSPGTD